MEALENVAGDAKDVGVSNNISVRRNGEIDGGNKVEWRTKHSANDDEWRDVPTWARMIAMSMTKTSDRGPPRHRSPKRRGEYFRTILDVAVI